MGKFEPGQVKPSGSGRKKGTRNRRSQDFTEAMDQLRLDVPAKLAALLPRLSVDKQADVLMGLLAYLYPKLKASEQQIRIQREMLEEDIIIHFVSPDPNIPTLVKTIEEARAEN